MESFNNIRLLCTDDKSVGLYSETTNDIFHSKTGALKEAKEKFVYPIINSGFVLKKELNVLDICYGIGYNSKALLSEFNKKNLLINIDALENSKDLIFLSAFINDCINDFDLSEFIFNSCINLIRTDKKNFKDFYDDNNVYFSQFILNLYSKLSNKGYINIPLDDFISNLHNIYYNYVSDSMNNDIKTNSYSNCSIRYYIDDARKSISKTNRLYDIVFLDAFTPKKDPTLWTIDFLCCVKNKMKTNSILLSYSKSTPFRSALTELGFITGKNIIDNKDMGTIASLNPLYIKTPLSKNDILLIKSRSGITYKDKYLNLDSNTILKNREQESLTSDRISRTQLEKTT